MPVRLFYEALAAHHAYHEGAFPRLPRFIFVFFRPGLILRYRPIHRLFQGIDEEITSIMAIRFKVRPKTGESRSCMCAKGVHGKVNIGLWSEFGAGRFRSDGIFASQASGF